MCINYAENAKSRFKSSTAMVKNHMLMLEKMAFGKKWRNFDHLSYTQETIIASSKNFKGYKEKTLRQKLKEM